MAPHPLRQLHNSLSLTSLSLQSGYFQSALCDGMQVITLYVDFLIKHLLNNLDWSSHRNSLFPPRLFQELFLSSVSHQRYWEVLANLHPVPPTLHIPCHFLPYPQEPLLSAHGSHKCSCISKGPVANTYPQEHWFNVVARVHSATAELPCWLSVLSQAALEA